MKCFLILNPGSGSGKSKKKFNVIFEKLNSSNIDYNYKITKTLDDAYSFSSQANSENYDAIIAVGGDGTINNALNGFYDNNGNKISKAAFGVIYTGTSPDFCKSYNIPLKLDDAINTIILGKTKKIKIGKINFSKSVNTSEINISEAKNNFVKYFACCVNIGLGATLARKANSGIRKYLGDFLGTFSALITTIIKYKPATYICEFNKSKKVVQKCYNLSVGITPLIASGIKVPKDPNIFNQFYIMGTCNLKFTTIFGVLKKIYSGKPFKNNDSLWLEYSNNVEIENNPKNPDIEFDGDPSGFLPCSISYANDDLDVIVSL